MDLSGTNQGLLIVVSSDVIQVSELSTSDLALLLVCAMILKLQSDEV
jgi:hypothetical protein